MKFARILVIAGIILFIAAFTVGAPAGNIVVVAPVPIVLGIVGIFALFLGIRGMK